MLRRSASAKIFLGGLLLGLAGFALHLTVDFHLKIPALLFFVAVFLGFIVRFSSRRSWFVGKLRYASEIGFAFWLLCAGVLLKTGIPAYMAAANYFLGREKLDKLLADSSRLNEKSAEINNIILQLNEAVKWDSGHADAWADLGFATMQLYWAQPENQLLLAERAHSSIEKALSITHEVWSYWAYDGLALLQMGRPLSEVRPCFKKAVEMAPNSANAWYYWAYFLSLDPAAKKEALQAVERALQLNPCLDVAGNLQKSISEH